MRYRTLGATDVEVSVVAMGCWAIVGDSTWGPQDESDAIAAIKMAMDQGVSLFDTAEAYGNGYSEELLGTALGNKRRDVVVASKVSSANLRPEDLRQSCEASLERLKTDYIDLYQIHWPNRNVPIGDTLQAMEDLQKEGKVRVIGCSNFGPRDLSHSLEQGRVETDQLAYNLLWRGVEDELQDMCVDEKVSILPYSPLQQGLLAGKFCDADAVPEGRARTRHFSSDRPEARHDEPGAEQLVFETIREVERIARSLNCPMVDVALAWLIAQPGVTSVVAGMRNAQQARQNAAAGDLDLPEDAMNELNRVTAPLKEHFRGCLDMWQTQSRLR